jgi:predicted RNA-binding Zn ribbon-like protein
VSSFQQITGVFRTQIGVGSAAVQIDVLDGQTYTSTSQVTQHPVEDGGDVTDHIIDKPDTLQLIAFFAQSLDDPDEQAAAAETRAQDLYQKLLEMKVAGERQTVFTSKREYENMVIERVTEPRMRSDGVTVTIDMVEIETATSQVVEAPPTRQRKNAKRNQGKKPKQPATEAQSVSAGAKTFDWIRGLL